MRTGNFEIENHIEGSHWWFLGRRDLIRSFIEQASIGPEAVVLDMGSSTGTNLRLLQSLNLKFYQGMDLSPTSVALCKTKGFKHILSGDLCHAPYVSQCADLILATDILEHIPNDTGAMEECFRLLRPGGSLLVTVPTFPILWGLQDEVSQHQRRYHLEPLQKSLEACGFQCQASFHFNVFLFFPVLVIRRLMKWFKVELKSEGQINAPGLNALMRMVFALDIAFSKRLKPPLGISAFLWLRKPLS